MKRYIVLLRGVNVSGKNKVPMKEWKEGLLALGFEKVQTVLNSGNAVFSAREEDCALLARRIREQIRERFGVDTHAHVLPAQRLKAVLEQAPDWWDKGDKEQYDNLIFALSPEQGADIAADLGKLNEQMEQAKIWEDVIFWSFSLARYRKSGWWANTAGEAVRERITVRTAGTVRKLLIAAEK